MCVISQDVNCFGEGDVLKVLTIDLHDLKQEMKSKNDSRSQINSMHFKQDKCILSFFLTSETHQLYSGMSITILFQTVLTRQFPPAVY